MTDNTELNINRFNDEIFNMILGANRWLLPDRDKYKDIDDVLQSLNYYKSAKSNPTKDEKEALNTLYETIDSTNHILIDGADEQLFSKLEKIIEEGEKHLSSALDWNFPRRQLMELKASGSSHSDNAVVFIMANNASRAAILEIPK